MPHTTQDDILFACWMVSETPSPSYRPVPPVCIFSKKAESDVQGIGCGECLGKEEEEAAGRRGEPSGPLHVGKSRKEDWQGEPQPSVPSKEGLGGSMTTPQTKVTCYKRI